MKSQVLIHFPWPWLTAVALLIFFAFFIGLLFHVTRRSTRKTYQEVSLLPLEEGFHHE